MVLNKSHTTVASSVVTNNFVPPTSIQPTSGSLASPTLTGVQSLQKKLPVREIQNSLASIVSGETSSPNPVHHFAASKSSSASSSFSASSEPSPQQLSQERHHTRGSVSAQSSLGDLPPLGGPIGSSGRNTLAPLKKIPPTSVGKYVENTVVKEKKSGGLYDLYGDLGSAEKGDRLLENRKSEASKRNLKIETAKQSQSGSEKYFAKNTADKGDIRKYNTKSIKNIVGGRSGSSSGTNSKHPEDPIIDEEDRLDSNDDDIEEDIDNFPDSIASGGDIGGSEDDFTKDETVVSGEDTSMKADYVIDLHS